MTGVQTCALPISENPFTVFEESKEIYAARREELRAWVKAQKAVEAEWRSANKELARKLDMFLASELPAIDYKSIEMKADSATRAASATVLGVPQETLDQYGAVSEETARAMAEGARQITGADIAVSVTGVAGPDRDERDNPVGLVYIGLATPEGTFCRRTDSGRRRRDRIQELAANHALDVVRRYLTGLPIG